MTPSSAGPPARQDIGGAAARDAAVRPDLGAPAP